MVVSGKLQRGLMPPFRCGAVIAILQHAGEDVVTVRNDDGCDINSFADSTLDWILPPVYRRLHIDDDDTTTVKILKLIGAGGARGGNG